MGFYNFAISGTETISEDFEKIKSKLNVDINDSLNRMSIYLITQLQNHINIDFYDKYDPTSYPRRKDYPQFGKSLLDKEYMDIETGLNTLTLTYLPQGGHSGKMKDTLNWNKKKGGKNGDNPIKPNPVHGNELIQRLQTGQGYDWQKKDGGFPPRPFWNLFIEDVERNFESRFIFELQSKGYDIKRKGKGFILDGTEKL